MRLNNKVVLLFTVGCSALVSLGLLLHLNDRNMEHRYSAVDDVTNLSTISATATSTSMKSFRSCCPSLEPSRPSTQKHTNVVFLKTHKTAGSTMQNILFRFAERHNLTVALPIQPCQHQFCYPHFFSVNAVHKFTLSPNILANHMRFNKEQLQRLMPPDTVYITIMREPGAMFESLFVYCYVSSQSIRRVPDKSLRTFLEHPWYYYRPYEEDSIYARNCMTFDLGGDKDQANVTYPKKFAAQVEEMFQLVMIAEYFDESLILLRHLLRWDLDDLVYFKLNMRTESSKQNITPSLLAKIREWNSIDSYLYDHFNASLWRQLSALGLDCVKKEVNQLRQIQEQHMKTCFGRDVALPCLAKQIGDTHVRPWQPDANVDVIGYELSPNVTSGSSIRVQCLKLITPEVQYSAALLQSQSLRYYHLNNAKRKHTVIVK